MMAIEKNSYKGAMFNSELSPGSRESLSSDDEELHRRGSAVDSDEEDDDEFDDADSGAGSDDFDLLELGETRAEFCRVGNSTCSVPFELYDLPGLEDILCIDVWNESLSEEERFSLTQQTGEEGDQRLARGIRGEGQDRYLNFSPLSIFAPRLTRSISSLRLRLPFSVRLSHYYSEGSLKNFPNAV